MPENKKSLIDFSQFTVFKERGNGFRIVVLILVFIIVLFTAYRIVYLLLDAKFPFPK